MKQTRNVHTKPTQADAELLPAYVSKASDKMAGD
jgi:hypothetical protein